ncbi:phosphatidylserine decarboxylase family protein [Ferruginibacter sp. HRS2-29]|uniref:phosphatidylserine decarboxylase family protein n=1 Tax=Ferruginibacter sp. HRS2-29 TaxID=2487334 RepID=UPI0020CF6690|nr:phosphatidylserine decarboxylase family protein [Ferruginibacter sp. HRS2-29]MCP9750466.1 phosphatidylserine decarboxylase family protein [Ferruginibacter sp. HRS2-29]
MTIHREGYKSIALATLVFGVINIALFWFFSASLLWICIAAFIITLVFLLFIVSFFRIPSRTLTLGDNLVVSPCDGKVVVIEETVDVEYFNEKRLQVSIFMSPANVHVNLNPLSGEVVYNQYHKGKYLVAWNPKSSTENERHSVVIKKDNVQVLVKQIAGAVAKRIVNYLHVGDKVQQGAELGFIKFGSRVDLLLPPGTKINVGLNEVVRGGVSVIATL